MRKIVLVRYGEIALKSEPVRKKFIKTLIQNLNSTITETPIEIRTERGRIFIKTQQPKKVATRVSNLPGIVSSSPTQKTKATMKKIINLATKTAEKSFTPDGSFAIRARRVGEHEFTSQDIENKIGTEVLKKFPEKSVDLDSPDEKLYIEVRNNNAYIFTKIIDGVGGLPVRTQGKIITFFSGKLTSAITTFLILRRGGLACPLFFKHKQNNEKEKIFKLGEKLLKFHPKLEIRVVPFQPVIDEISKNVPPKFRWLICKRLSLKISEKVANEIGAKAIATEETLKQTANQTLQHTMITQAKTKLPIIQPLHGLSEEEIENTSKKIIKKSPSNENLQICPWTSPKSRKIELEKIQRIEKEKIMSKSLINSALNSIEVHKLEV